MELGHLADGCRWREEIRRTGLPLLLKRNVLVAGALYNLPECLSPHGAARVRLVAQASKLDLHYHGQAIPTRQVLTPARGEAMMPFVDKVNGLVRKEAIRDGTSKSQPNGGPMWVV